MLVLCAIIHIEVVQQRAAERAFGQHALHGVTDDSFRSVWALAQLGRSVEALTTGITSIAGVNLISLLLSGENHLGGIDNDYIVTAIYVRCEVGFVLSADQLGYFGAKTTYDLVAGIDYDPLFLSCFLVGGNSLET